MRDPGQGIVQGGCLHVHLPPFGDDDAILGVGHAGIDLRRAQFEFDATAAAQWDVYRFCGAQQGRATAGFDAAFVGDAGTQQCHIAAIGSQPALIEDGADRAIALKAHVAGHEVSVRDAQSRRCEAGGRDRSILAEGHAVGVDEHDLPIGRELPKDLRG